MKKHYGANARMGGKKKAGVNFFTPAILMIAECGGALCAASLQTVSPTSLIWLIANSAIDVILSASLIILGFCGKYKQKVAKLQTFCHFFTIICYKGYNAD